MKSKRTTLTTILATLAMSLGSMAPASADPCGMVPPPPPLELATSATIERIGVQKTYVAHSKGMETMVLRPGFQGNVEEFGMLIPFPSPPALRKVDDNIFSHIAAAIDPPEVIARVQRVSRMSMAPMSRAMGGAVAKSAMARDESELAFDEVRVVKQEAVGMYEVATLAAGSPKALKRWMDDNNFRYPSGMDEVVNDYVASKWFFVAIKTNVGSKAGVNPRPGMREANAKRPAGTTFNGFVQAMGFRFETKDLVVPMRLSVFNAAGNARNIVYVLTDKPTKISGIPESYVKRQISGKRLYQNVTNPLPLRVIGGTKSDLAPYQLQSLAQRRDPTPHNGLAKELFGADMLAMSTGKMTNPVEDKAKALLNIGEAFGMRGVEIDALNREELAEQTGRMAKQSLDRLSRMTLSVIDGEFDRNVLAKANLKFAPHRMAAKSNSKMNYDAIQQGPGVNMGGKLYLWEVAANEPDPVPSLFRVFATDVDDGRLNPNEDNRPSTGVGGFTGTGGGGDGGSGTMPLAMLIGLMGIGFALHRKRLQPAIVAAALLLAGSGLASAQSVQTMVSQFEADNGEDAIARIAKGGDDTLESLVAVATSKDHPVAAGRAVLAIVKIGSSNADAQLAKISQNGANSVLVRSWAAAGRIQLARSSDELMALEGLSQGLPATRRPWTKRLALFAQNGNVDDMLIAITRVPELRAELTTALQAAPTNKLIEAMLHSSNMQTRQQAAGFLGLKGEGTGKLMAEALRFDKNASETPWHGGPLYLPGIAWSKKDASAVANQLIRWMVWADKNGKTDEVRVAANNLMAQAIAQGAGYAPATGSEAYTVEYWLGMWTKTFGSKAVSRILKDVK